MIRVYDNWVRNALDTTKTSDSEAIPMTPRLARALAKVMDRDYATENEDLCSQARTATAPSANGRCAMRSSSPSGRPGLKPIKMYNLRHSFGTTLARAEST